MNEIRRQLKDEHKPCPKCKGECKTDVHFCFTKTYLRRDCPQCGKFVTQHPYNDPSPFTPEE